MRICSKVRYWFCFHPSVHCWLKILASFSTFSPPFLISLFYPLCCFVYSLLIFHTASDLLLYFYSLLLECPNNASLLFSLSDNFTSSSLMQLATNPVSRAIISESCGRHIPSMPLLFINIGKRRYVLPIYVRLPLVRLRLRQQHHLFTRFLLLFGLYIFNTSTFFFARCSKI